MPFVGASLMEFNVSLTTLILACIGGTFFVISTVIFFQEIGEVNRKLPDNEQISFWFMHSDKFWIKHEYKGLYPQGHLHQWRLAFELIGIALMYLAWRSSGLFPHSGPK
jgi:hypothetical protein